MRKPFDDFEPIRIQLRVAIARKVPNGGHFIQTMVSDAQKVRHHPEKIGSIGRATYRYSVTLGRGGASFLDRMNPNHLTERDLRELLLFFESL